MKRKYIIGIITLILVFILGTGIYVYKSVTAVPEMFQLNEKLKSEGYYMAEFEFKMLGSAYYLDRGQYIKAISQLNRMHQQLKSREGLIKMPQFNNKREELEFYLNLQNPRTGAFMDDNYPIFTYIGPTANVLYHIESLCSETGQPLRLKYPLKFLDDINTPETLRAFLDDISTVGGIGSKFRPPYIAATELNGYPEDMRRTGLYKFSPEWQKALLQWFYDNQDSQTGYWGAKSRGSGKLLDSGDLLSTEKILKLFVDFQGNNLYPEFPLRYQDKMFATTLEKLSQPMPKDRDEVHEWTLVMNRGTRLLTRYLWSGAALESKNSARAFMKNIVIGKYEQCYIQTEKAFSLYPGAQHADLDGTGETLSYLDEIGSLSSARQKLLWGSPEKHIINLGILDVHSMQESDFSPLINAAEVNSIRLYREEPKQDDYTSNVASVFYPRATPVLDAMELLPGLSRWLSTTDQSMGNWVAKESIIDELNQLDPQNTPVYRQDIPVEEADKILQTDHQLTAIGFDVLQMPQYKMVFRLK